MAQFSVLLRELVAKSDDSSQIDWSSVFVLAVYAMLFVAILIPMVAACFTGISFSESPH
ncbi:hypothetical protein [Planctomicrobium piriforme]|uniref:Uncharacterized protein n=1 Tax=Planctomicrobium piriforme TaxID=1576369 RepID=A0A1I3HTK2_9PLAN|nr:hypothetical protein [Planctomicrobium piriforme]SFI38939.1 hypothetical protein SAMN05421753_108185 [Planctomicrobium piriforme]